MSVAEWPAVEVKEAVATSSGEATSERMAWLARAIIFAGAIFFAWYTWGHWGDFQVDCGREIYVPAAILQGKLLFRDIWYMYGPLAPYLQALLFRLFGVHLTVLYLFGLTLTIGTALLIFEIAREIDFSAAASLVPAVFFLAEAFGPFIFNFIFPYSYSASLGTFLGLACLYFVLKQARHVRFVDLAIAAALCGLALLTKQEVGFACCALLGMFLAISFLIRRSWRELATQFAVCLAGLSPALLVYGWFAWKLSPKVLFLDNWISTPGTYFMRVWGRQIMAYQGFRFSGSEVVSLLEHALLAAALWYALASLIAFIVRKLRFGSRLSLAAIAAASLLFLAVFLCGGWTARFLLAPLMRPPTSPMRLSLANAVIGLQDICGQMILPKGLFLFGIFFLFQESWKSWEGHKSEFDARGVILGAYALLASCRVIWGTSPSPYKIALFFNVPLYLIFVIYLGRIVRWSARSLKTEQSSFLALSLLVVDVTVFGLMQFPAPRLLPSAFTTQYGTLYTWPDVAEILPNIISFMKTHTRNNKDILVLPEPPSLYVFAGMECPTRWYSLVPGYVPPDKEADYIQEIRDVRYILIGNRSVPGYGVPDFVNGGYDISVYKWFLTNFERVGQFGPLPYKNSTVPPYIVWIYARKGLTPESPLLARPHH